MSRRARSRDMTRGEPAMLILRFGIPVLFGSVFQQLYILVDALVIGQAEGVLALTAVSASSWIVWAVEHMCLGMTQGFSVQVAQDFGAGRADRLHRTIARSVVLSVCIAVVMTVLPLWLLTPSLRLMQMPPEVLPMTQVYLRVILSGVPLHVGTCLCSGILSAMGNSRTPFRALAVSSLANVAGDLLLVGVMHMGVGGAALCTVLSKGISLAVCLGALLRSGVLGLRRSDLRLDRESLRLLRLGIPMALSNLTVAVSGMVLQRMANSFGVIAAAGYNTASTLQSPLEETGMAIGHAAGTFAGQNTGANLPRRVRDGVRKAGWMAAGTGVLLGLLVAANARGILSLFVHAEPQMEEAVLDGATRFLYYICAGLPVLYLLFVLRHSLQGMGNTRVPFLTGVVELVARISLGLLLPPLMGISGVYVAEVSAWIADTLLLAAGYRKTLSVLERTGRETTEAGEWRK